MKLRACTYKSVKAILRNNLEQQELEAEAAQNALPLHENASVSLGGTKSTRELRVP